MRKYICPLLLAAALLFSGACAVSSATNGSAGAAAESPAPVLPAEHDEAETPAVLRAPGAEAQSSESAAVITEAKTTAVNGASQLSSSPAAAEAAASTATLYLPNANADGFDVLSAEFDGTAAGLVDALVAAGALPEGCEALDFCIAGDRTEAVLNMNALFGSALTTTGTAGETMMLGALVNSLLNYFQLTEVSVLVEGQVLETGHAIYDEPLTFYAG